MSDTTAIIEQQSINDVSVTDSIQNPLSILSLS